MDTATRERFLEGLDDIDLSLSHETAIAEYESGRAGWLPTTA
jgi:3-isopropylmalate/(R)-2-methylmalate dehydratase small subunit